MYKTELHCHSLDASPCSRLSAEQLVDIYQKAGYDTVVLTNHFASCVYQVYGCKSYEEYIEIFTGAFKKFKEAAKGKLTVLLGAEVRFNSAFNDYLLIGDFLDYVKKTPEIFDFTPERFHEICKENGWLFVQAHPFRHGMTIINPTCLDGVEVYNGHIGHAQRNFIAELWAEEYGLIKTSGTDIHYDYVPASGGILTSEKIVDMTQLVSVLKSGEYQLLKSENIR